MFVASALPCRPNWEPEARAFFRRLDHAAVFLLIVGKWWFGCTARQPRICSTATAVLLHGIAHVWHTSSGRRSAHGTLRCDWRSACCPPVWPCRRHKHASGAHSAARRAGAYHGWLVSFAACNCWLLDAASMSEQPSLRWRQSSSAQSVPKACLSQSSPLSQWGSAMVDLSLLASNLNLLSPAHDRALRFLPLRHTVHAAAVHRVGRRTGRHCAVHVLLARSQVPCCQPVSGWG